MQGIRSVRPALHSPGPRALARDSPRARSARGCCELAQLQEHRPASPTGTTASSSMRPIGSCIMHQRLQRPEMRVHPSRRGSKRRSARSASVPQIMVFSEVYQALQTGTVDGTEEPLVQHVHPAHERSAEACHGLQSWLSRLCGDREQEVLGRPPSRCARDARTRNGGGDNLCPTRSLSRKISDALEAIKKSGTTEIVTLTADQNEAMRKAMMPVYKDVANRVGQPLIDEFLKETGRSPMN